MRIHDRQHAAGSLRISERPVRVAVTPLDSRVRYAPAAGNSAWSHLT